MDVNKQKKLNRITQEELAISKIFRPEPSSLGDVFADIERYGAHETQLMPQAFLSNTQEDSRSAHKFGYRGLAVHLAKGIYTHCPELELSLISAHKPGSPSGKWWGLKPIRRIQLAYNQTNPRALIGSPLAQAYEDDGRIHFDCIRGQEVLSTSLRIAIEEGR